VRAGDPVQQVDLEPSGRRGDRSLHEEGLEMEKNILFWKWQKREILW
jgi:hypothetical protein